MKEGRRGGRHGRSGRRFGLPVEVRPFFSSVCGVGYQLFDGWRTFGLFVQSIGVTVHQYRLRQSFQYEMGNTVWED